MPDAQSQIAAQREQIKDLSAKVDELTAEVDESRQAKKVSSKTS